jgi:parallel beta-helix repeat protein
MPDKQSVQNGGKSMGKLTLTVALVGCAAVGIASAEAAIVVVSNTIQAAVSKAKPGDIILVPPGTYRETVRVLKDNITILGSEGAIIDASGFANGIHVGADIFGQGPNGIPICPAVAVKHFTLIGLTIQNAVNNGIFLSGVDNYILAHGTYLDNGDYGTYPSCSDNGQINFNYVKGGGDTCIYVGNDVETSVIGNVASDCTVGVQIVNSDDVIIRDNIVTGNSTGIVAIVDPGNPRTETSDVLIARNRIENNNRPNTSTEGDLERIPSGAGILIVGSDNVRIRRNEVTGNNTFGVAITQNPLASQDPRNIDPNPDGDEVRRNVVVNNGTRPSGGLPAADLFYDGSGQDNCFARNRFVTSVPPKIEASFPCH